MKNCRNCKYLTEVPDTIDDKWIYYLDCKYGNSLCITGEIKCEQWEKLR